MNALQSQTDILAHLTFGYYSYVMSLLEKRNSERF